MEYLLFIATDQNPDAQSETADMIAKWLEEGERRGIRKHGNRLRPAADAKTVRVRRGELLVTQGPFTKSKEQIVGYDIIDCSDLEQAIDYVSRHPMARFGRIEIRQVWPVTE
jgi:hypothetical protein